MLHLYKIICKHIHVFSNIAEEQALVPVKTKTSGVSVFFAGEAPIGEVANDNVVSVWSIVNQDEEWALAEVMPAEETGKSCLHSQIRELQDQCCNYHVVVPKKMTEGVTLARRCLEMELQLAKSDLELCKAQRELNKNS